MPCYTPASHNPRQQHCTRRHCGLDVLHLDTCVGNNFGTCKQVSVKWTYHTVILSHGDCAEAAAKWLPNSSKATETKESIFAKAAHDLCHTDDAKYTLLKLQIIFQHSYSLFLSSVAEPPPENHPSHTQDRKGHWWIVGPESTVRARWGTYQLGVPFQCPTPICTNHTSWHPMYHRNILDAELHSTPLRALKGLHQFRAQAKRGGFYPMHIIVILFFCHAIQKAVQGRKRLCYVRPLKLASVFLVEHLIGSARDSVGPKANTTQF